MTVDVDGAGQDVEAGGIKRFGRHDLFSGCKHVRDATATCDQRSWLEAGRHSKGAAEDSEVCGHGRRRPSVGARHVIVTDPTR